MHLLLAAVAALTLGADTFRPIPTALLPGQSGVVFSYYGAPADAAELRALVEVLRRENLANGFDPGPPPFPELQAAYDYLATIAWPIITLPPRYGEFQIAGGRSRLEEANELLLRQLDKAGIFTALQLGEWGYYFHDLSHTESWWRSVYGEDFPTYQHLMKPRDLHGFDPRPATRQEACEQVRAYYTERNGAQRGWNMSVTGHSHYECYAATWGTRAVGIEIGENIAFTQSKLAFTRGAARQAGLPFTAQISPWYGRSCTSAGPLLRGADGIMRGQDAGHSLSLYRRLWLHAWFAGAALVTPENSAAMWFEPGDAKYQLTPLARAAQEAFAFMQSHDRGVPYTPLAVVIDRYAGYNGFQGKPWGIFENTPADLELRDLLERQLFPGADHVHGGIPPGEHEQHYLRPTPHGEIADVFLSTVTAKTLMHYPAVLLAGDISFDDELIKALRATLRAGARVLLHPRHAEGLGSALGKLRRAGDVEVLEAWTNPETGRPAAISDARLHALAEAYLPVSVGGGPVLYQVNRNAAGWVVELVNNAGIDKRPDQPARIDPAAAVEVHLHLREPGAHATDWCTGADLEATPSGEIFLRIPPGETRFVAITR